MPRYRSFTTCSMTTGAEHSQNVHWHLSFYEWNILDLFVLGFASHSKFFHSFVEVTITGKGLQILTYARHLWPLSSEFFNVPHILWRGSTLYYGQLIFEDPWHSPVEVKLSLPVLNPDPPHTRRSLYHYTIAAVTILEMVVNNQSVHYNISIIDYFFVISCEN